MDTTQDYMRILMTRCPIVDVRSPMEFSQGSIPYSINLPIMNDAERHSVGICYKNRGQEKAIQLGHTLVSGEIRENRTNAWARFFETTPNALICCFRGGLRSSIAQHWIHEATGKKPLRIQGGYKAFRNFLIDAIKPENLSVRTLVLSGYTGSGKTQLLQKTRFGCDLESIANHRGSTFGAFFSSQPTQSNFENLLAYAILSKTQKQISHLLFEDEGRHVGKCYLPNELAIQLKNSPRIRLHTPLEERIQAILNEYVIEAQQTAVELYRDAGFEYWQKSFSDSILRIEKRLGRERFLRVYQAFQHAVAFQKEHDSFSLYTNWIFLLLTQYYDPMYEFQMKKFPSKVLFEGNSTEVMEYLKALK